MLGSAAAAAQSWPAKPIRLISIFAAGSSGDLFVRLVTPGFAENLGQPVVIENVTGAGGVGGRRTRGAGRANRNLEVASGWRPSGEDPKRP